MVLYDPAVPATSNVASTVAGADDLLPVCSRPESPMYELPIHQLEIPVVISLVGRFNGTFSGSAKCDAYLWAAQEYLASGRSSHTNMAYFVDYYWVYLVPPLSTSNLDHRFRFTAIVF